MIPLPSGAEATEPVRYWIDPHAGLVFVVLRGDVTFSDLCVAQSEMLEHPDYRPGMGIYVDCRVLMSIPAAGALRRLALDRLLRSASMPVGKLGMVAMTRLGLTFATTISDFLDAEEDEVRVFTSQEAANEWLGLGADFRP